MEIKNASLKDLSFCLEGLYKTRKLAGWKAKNAMIGPKEKDGFTNSINEGRIRIALIDNKRAGFIHYKLNFPVMYMEDFLWVDIVYVDDNFRRKGIGQALYEDVTKKAKEAEVSKIVIDIAEVNKDSATFHAKMGFIPVYTIYEKELK